jgi:hypothetical protein
MPRTGLLLLLPLLAAAPPAGAQTTGDARRFVTGLYDAYAHSEPDYAGRQARQVFSPRLLALMRRDARRAHGEVGALDGDPICDCQDPAGLQPTWVGIDRATPGHVTARVELKFPDGREVITLDLVPVRGQWRVDDVHSPSTPSLVKLLDAPPGS